ncbi:MAG: hypothetical protein ACD_73C00792G0011, partial [uncultured bacterium]
SCSRTYSIGWPIALINYDNTDTQSAALGNFFTEAWIKSPHLFSGIVFNVFVLIGIFFLLHRFFNSRYYLSRASFFKFSKQFCIFYSLIFSLIGWFFILQNPAWSRLTDLLSVIYLMPLLYTGGLFVLAINKYTFEAKNIDLFPYAFLCSLIIYWWLCFFITKLYKACLNKWRNMKSQ